MALSLVWVCVPVLLRGGGLVLLGEEAEDEEKEGEEAGNGGEVVLLSLRGRPRGLSCVLVPVAVVAAAESSLGLLCEPLGRPRGRLPVGGAASGGIVCVEGLCDVVWVKGRA